MAHFLPQVPSEMTQGAANHEMKIWQESGFLLAPQEPTTKVVEITNI